MEMLGADKRKTFKEIFHESREKHRAAYEEKEKDIDNFLEFSNRLIAEKNANKPARIKPRGALSNLGMWLGLSWLFG